MYVLSMMEHIKLKSIYNLSSRLRLSLSSIEEQSLDATVLFNSLTESMSTMKEFLPGEVPSQKPSWDFSRDAVRLYKKIERFRLKLNTLYRDSRRLNDVLRDLQASLYVYLLG